MEKNKHYDVGIVGWWFASNYGSALTYYALGKILQDKGLSSVMLQISKLNRTPWEPETKKTIDFITRYFPMSDVRPIENNPEYNNLCDTFMLGSDQLWTKLAVDLLGYTFFLDFADNSKKKIAYSTSFGNASFNGTDDQKAYIHTLLNSFDYISVREASGIEACKQSFGLDVKRDLDPVFLCERENYDLLADSCGQLEPDDNFIFSYILDVNEEKQKAVQYAAEKLGARIVSVLDMKSVNRQKGNWHTGDLKENASIEEFVYYIKHCKMLITDSHHGACFGMIYNKNLITISNAGRGLTRFTHLFNLFQLNHKLLADPNEIYKSDQIFDPIDYDKFNAILAKEKAESFARFNQALDAPRSEEKKNMPKSRSIVEYEKTHAPLRNVPRKCIEGVLAKQDCIGCGSCVSICPKNAITLTPDEFGYYRSTVDADKCVDCSLCINACPAVKLPENKNFTAPECFAFVASDDEVLKRSSSGGAFPTLANETFRRNGAVVGAAWNDEFTVEHRIITNKEQLPLLQKAKYMQSYLGDTFQKVKERLDANQFVLFSGCPCQVAGLKAYLGNKEYDNLIMVDLLCTSAPSPMFFKKYTEDEYPNGLESYSFRYKHDSAKWDCVSVSVKEKGRDTEIKRGGSEDSYQRVFHNHTMTAHHCETCKYQGSQRMGDITIGDFWNIERKDKQFTDGKGVSCLILNNEKAKQFIASIPADEIAVMKKVPYSWLGANGLSNNAKNFASPKRDDFYKAITTMPFLDASNYALKPRTTDNSSLKAQNTAPLQFISNALHFTFNSEYWEENTIFGRPVLFVKPGQNKIGRFATLPLQTTLERGKRYEFAVKFKTKTNFKRICFYIKDSGTNYFKEVGAYNMPANGESTWIEIKNEFTVKTNIYDEFMIAASNFAGDGNYIAFEYICVTEKK